MRLGCDIGGTFTDFVLLDDQSGEIVVHKRLTTPGDPSDAVMQGIAELGRRIPECPTGLSEVIHGTTLVINAIIERKGARTGLLTTAGFRDVLQLGREMRYAPYDIFAPLPQPLVPRRRRLEVQERIRADGAIWQPLNEEQARAAVRELLSADVQSVAVCLLNSFANPTHEYALRDIVHQEAPGLSLSISYEVLPQIREYERTSTTVANAYVKPLTEAYLRRLEERLAGAGFAGRLFIMLSSGGVTSVATAADFPVRIIESGPTAAVIASRYFSQLFQLPDVFCFDMGGTTAKSCLIQHGEVNIVDTFEVGRVRRFMRGSGLPIQAPVVDLLEIGAGGGSIARVSRTGTLQVGPQSAGAAPGPVCYAQGGSQPTVTDADLVLGYLDEAYFLGGEMPLDVVAARRAMEEQIALPLGISPIQAAWGIHELINETMAAAAKAHIAERGGNPQAVTLIAFGGAGPLHAYGLARKLGAPCILVPPNAGVGSALGFFTAPRAFDLLRSYIVPLERADFAAIEALFQELEAEGAQTLRRAGATGKINFQRGVDARFAGQGAETTLPLPAQPFTELDIPGLRRRFDDLYTRLYGRTYPEIAVEFVNFRVRAGLPLAPLRLPRLAAAEKDVAAARKGERPAYSAAAGDFIPHAVYDRYKLPAGAQFAGPAIIEERESTVLAGEGAAVSVDEYGFVWIEPVAATLPVNGSEP